MPFGGLLTAGIISGATSIYGAHKASQASKQAADIQQQSARESQALKASMYNRSQENLAPWMAGGSGAMLKLADLLKVPMVGRNGPVNPADVSSGKVSLASFAPEAVYAPGSAGANSQRIAQAYRDALGRDPEGDMLQARSQYGGPMTDAQVQEQVRSIYQSPEANLRRQQTAGMVTVQAPDGRRKQMSQAEADHYVSRGARIVG